MRKQLLCLACATVLSMGLTACGDSKSQETTVATSSVEATSESTTTEAETTTKKTDVSKLKKIELNKAYTVKTDDGSYSFTITGAKRVDWIDSDTEEIMLLEYTVENKDYKPSDGSLLMLNASSFKVSDTNGNAFKEWDTTLSEYGMPDFVEPGEKKKQEQPYVINKDTKKVQVVFQNKGQDEASITLDVE